MRLLLILTIFLISIATGCKNNPKKEYEKVVKEWIGKTIQFPDSMQLISGEFITPPTSDFTILGYYDSIGCTGCRMKLEAWQQFMTMADSVLTSNKLKLLLIADTQDIDELKYLIMRNKFSYDVVYDVTGTLNKKNGFPKQPGLQAFLLDKNHSVLAIGNPIYFSNLKELYLSYMTDSNLLDYPSQQVSESEHNYEYNMGKILSGQEFTHTFRFFNNLKDTLKIKDILISCECVKANVSPKIIPPKTHYLVETSFKDTIQGDILRSITLLFENDVSEIRLELSGEIIDNNQTLI